MVQKITRIKGKFDTENKKLLHKTKMKIKMVMKRSRRYHKKGRT